MGSQSGSSSRVGVKYVLTGFSAFHGVDRNPTENLITELVEFCERNGEDTQCFFSCTVLKVSVTACDDFLAQMADRVTQELGNETVFWIHLGVDPGSSTISLESRAMNNASFLSPDEDGCQYLYHQIDKDSPYDQPLFTTLNIDSITSKTPNSRTPEHCVVKERLNRLGIRVRKSFDAGRFLCNWIYYRSLRQAQLLSKPNWHPLFVHVPHFTQISKDAQLTAITSLLKALAEEAQQQHQDHAGNDVTRTTVNLNV